jgi:hypothetical protein
LSSEKDGGISVVDKLPPFETFEKPYVSYSAHTVFVVRGGGASEYFLIKMAQPLFQQRQRIAATFNAGQIFRRA